MRGEKLAALVIVVAALSATGASCLPTYMPRHPVDIDMLDAGLGDREYFKGDYKDLRRHTFCDSGEDFDPEISPKKGLLIFASTRNSYTSDIYFKERDSTTFQQVTAHTANDRFPRFMPGSDDVFAFTSDRTGSWDLYIKTNLDTEYTLDGENRDRSIVPLTDLDGDVLYPSWSPREGTAGERDLSFNYLNPRTRVFEIWILTIDSKYRRVNLRKVGEGIMPRWSPVPSERKLVFQRPRGRDTAWYSLWTLTLPTGDKSAKGAEPVLESLVWDTHWAAINPSYDAKGDMVVFASSYKSPGAVRDNRIYHADDIWVVSADGEKLIQITNTPYPEWAPIWGPDGRIYFTTVVRGNKNIWSILPVDLPRTE